MTMKTLQYTRDHHNTQNCWIS